MKEPQDTPVVSYLRVSTKDKDQDPDRQRHVIESAGYTARETVIDVGTSASKVEPLDRPKYVEACKLARELGLPLIMAGVSRFNRMGLESHFYNKRLTKEKYGVDVRFVSVDPEDPWMEMLEVFKAWQATAETRALSERVKSKIEQQKDAKKYKGGRPRKVPTKVEIELINELKEKGLGFRKIAAEISIRRGADKIADKRSKTYRKLAVSHRWVERVYKGEI